MKLRIEFDMDNAAFADDGLSGMYEAARILRDAAKHLERDGEGRTLHDSNGNAVGRMEIIED